MPNILTKQEVNDILKGGPKSWSIRSVGDIAYSLRFYINKTDELEIALDEMCEECQYDTKKL